MNTTPKTRLSPKQRTNLKQLADYLSSLPEDCNLLDMGAAPTDADPTSLVVQSDGHCLRKENDHD
jgi:hypothetical protein